MVDVHRTTAIWQGFQGSPGYTRFSWMDLDTDAARNAAGAAMRAYFAATAAYMSTGWTVTVQPTIQVFDMTTGVLTAETTMSTPPTVVTGTAASTVWAGGSGFCTSWKTGIIWEGRRVQGRTFHVPATACFATDGTLDPAVIVAVQAAGAQLIAAASAQFSIWAKKFTVVPPGSTEKPVQIGGAIAPVSACTVKDQASQMRSRRN